MVASSGVARNESLPDACTRSNYLEVRLEHIHFDWTVVWARRRFTCVATYLVAALEDGPRRPSKAAPRRQLVLDAKNLEIREVTVADSAVSSACFKPTEWSLDRQGCRGKSSAGVVASAAKLGDALRITIGGGRQKVRIEYSTTRAGSSLHWQRNGSSEFVYSHNWCLRGRELFPCQDTPGAKVPFDAVVRTARRRDRALMSASRTKEAWTKGSGWAFEFSQKKPVPSYLVGVSVGPWTSRVVGQATVWGLRSHAGFKLACNALADIDSDVARMEAVVGPMPWPSLEFLQLPGKASPFENQQMIYLTGQVNPYLNRRQIAVHELAHQWFGNWVTPARWRDLWLSEGFATFMERYLVAGYVDGKVLGRYVAGERKNLAVVVSKLQRRKRGQVARIVCEDLGRKDPDKVLDESDYYIPYEKGFLLLCRLRDAVGESDFWRFLRCYLKAFGGRTASTEDFIALWKKFFPRAESIDWRGWLHSTDLPAEAGLVPCDGGFATTPPSTAATRRSAAPPKAGRIIGRKRRGGDLADAAPLKKGRTKAPKKYS